MFTAAVLFAYLVGRACRSRVNTHQTPAAHACSYREAFVGSMFVPHPNASCDRTNQGRVSTCQVTQPESKGQPDGSATPEAPMPEPSTTTSTFGRRMVIMLGSCCTHKIYIRPALFTSDGICGFLSFLVGKPTVRPGAFVQFWQYVHVLKMRFQCSGSCWA